MTDPATTTEAQSSGATATSTGAHPTGSSASDPKPAPLPHLKVGIDRQYEKWVLYLQQMFNFHYSSQVVTENGEYDSQTAGVVEHFRSQQHLRGGTDCDAEVWEKLGVEDPLETWKRAHPQGSGGGAHGQQHGQQHEAQHGGQNGHQAEHAYEPVYHNIDFIAAPSDGSCWAAAMAMVLNAKGLGSFTVESVCQQVHVEVNDFKSASDVRGHGPELGLSPLVVNGSTPGGWAQALHAGPVWAPNPKNDHNVLVIAGVSGTGAEAIIHVVDPQSNFNDWMDFRLFFDHYGFGDGQEMLG